MNIYKANLLGFVAELIKHQLDVGLDPEWEKIPSALKKAVILSNPNSGGKEDNDGSFAGMSADEFFEMVLGAKAEVVHLFCQNIINESPIKVFKLNLAFFLAIGPEGVKALIDVIAYIHEIGGYAILDGKFSDIGNTAKEYAKFAYKICNADAVTLNPYLGGDALQPFFDYEDRMNFVLCHTTNPGSKEIEELVCQDGRLVYEVVADLCKNKWNSKNNVALVLGSTAPETIEKIRKIVGDDMLILSPGIGAQGGDLEKSMKHGGIKIFFNVSRAIIFVSSDVDFATKASIAAHGFISQIKLIKGGDRVS